MSDEIKVSSDKYKLIDGEWWYVHTEKPLVRFRAYVRECANCKQKCVTRNEKDERIYCSSACGGKSKGGHSGKTGEKNHRWKGGRRISPKGYVLIYKPDYPGPKHGGKYVLEHRLVMEEMIGRQLKPEEHVHHKNGIKADNRPENLELWTGSHPYGVRWEDLLEPLEEVVNAIDHLEMPDDVREAIEMVRPMFRKKG
jgi:hypothetical protein